jgi:flagellar motor switch/type III secretory pathway protein FliN
MSEITKLICYTANKPGDPAYSQPVEGLEFYEKYSDRLKAFSEISISETAELRELHLRLLGEKLFEAAPPANKTGHKESKKSGTEVLSQEEIDELLTATVPDIIGKKHLREMRIPVKLDIGRLDLTLDEIYQIREGSLIELFNSLEKPMRVFANNIHIANAKPVIRGDKIFANITEIVAEGILDNRLVR